jgi:DNA-binding transcriptional ArsR family regulator
MKNVSEELSGMKHGLTDLCYGFFSTLANPTRLTIIELLYSSPMTVSQMVEALGHEQSMVSHNLKPLVRCKFVRVKQQGKNRVYSLNHETLDPIISVVESHASKFCGNKANCPARRRSEASLLEE